jgi:hypothetical protein
MAAVTRPPSRDRDYLLNQINWGHTVNVDGVSYSKSNVGDLPSQAELDAGVTNAGKQGAVGVTTHAVKLYNGHPAAAFAGLSDEDALKLLDGNGELLADVRSAAAAPALFNGHPLSAFTGKNNTDALKLLGGDAELLKQVRAAQKLK